MVEKLITEHLDTWTSAIKAKSSAGRGGGKKRELYGIKKLRELILELAVRGLLVPQDPNDEPASELLKKIAAEKRQLASEKKIKKPKKLPAISDSEKYEALPPEWEYVRLNDLGEWGAGATPRRGDSGLYGGAIPWFKSGELVGDYISESEETVTELALKKSSLRYNKPGDVLLAMYGATIGKTSILSVAATTNQAVCACTPFSGFSNIFLLTLLKAYKPRFTRMGAGGAQPNISREKIINTVVALPPTAEQHRIVAKVDELMALCDQLELRQEDSQRTHQTLVKTLLGALTTASDPAQFPKAWKMIESNFDTLFTTESSIDELKQTILQLAVMGKLVPQNQNDEPASELLKRVAQEKVRLIEANRVKRTKVGANQIDESMLHVIPKQWKWAKLVDVANPQDPNPSHRMPKYVESGGHPFVSTENFSEDDSINFSVGKRIAEETLNQQIARFPIEESTFAFSRIGTIGKTRPLPQKRSYGISHALCVISPLTKDILGDYLRLVMSAESSLIYAHSETKSIGVPDLGMGVIRTMPIPVPPHREQHRIVAKVDELMALCDRLKASLQTAQTTQLHLADTLVETAIQ